MDVFNDSVQKPDFLQKNQHHKIVNGINLETVVWTYNDAIIPVDFRTYDIDTDGKTKNDHFLDMLNKAKERGFRPKFVLFNT